MPTSHLPVTQAGGSSLALTRSNNAPAVSPLARLPARALPLARRSLVAAGAALATEYALRAALGGALDRLLAPVAATPAIIRTEVTEWLIVERVRRR